VENNGFCDVIDKLKVLSIGYLTETTTFPSIGIKSKKKLST